MSYIGQQPLNNFVTKQSQTFTPDGSTTGFTLNFAVTSGVDIMLVINNVVQEPGGGKAYTASGTTLTMSEAPGASDSMYCIFLGLALQTVNPGDGSVGTSKLVDSAVTNAKIANSTIDLTSKVTGVLPSANGQVMTPAFQAYMNSTQTGVASETATKLNIDTEEWDTDSNFDTTNNRFLPTTAGKYFIYGGYRFDSGSADQVKYAEIRLYKNGSVYKDGVQVGNYNTQTFRNMLLTVSTVVDMNGSSDYVELFALRHTASGTDITAGSRYTYFGGYKLIGA